MSSTADFAFDVDPAFTAKRPRTAGNASTQAGRTAPVPSELAIHLATVAELKWRGVPGLWWTHPANTDLRDNTTAANLKAMGVCL